MTSNCADWSIRLRDSKHIQMRQPLGFTDLGARLRDGIKLNAGGFLFGAFTEIPIINIIYYSSSLSNYYCPFHDYFLLGKLRYV